MRFLEKNLARIDPSLARENQETNDFSGNYRNYTMPLFTSQDEKKEKKELHPRNLIKF